MVPPTVDPLISVNMIKIIPYRQAHRLTELHSLALTLSFQVILDCVKLTIRTKHYRG